MDFLICALREHFWRYAHAIRFPVGLHMAHRNSIQLLYMKTTKFEVEREPV